MSVAAPAGQALADIAGAELVVAGREDDVATIVAGIRARPNADVIILLVGADVAPLDRALMLAAIAPLAVELAPRVRLAAIDAVPDAAPEDIAAAARFLALARSTTGQILVVRPASGFQGLRSG